VKVLLTGAGGMLGSAFNSMLHASGHEVLPVGREALDVRDASAIDTLIRNSAPALVVNCAAHTDVEAAEREPDSCFSANAILPSIIAWACRRSNATLLHMSSTGCYGDWKREAYTEDDDLRPTTVHHRSKAAGENAVRESGCEHLILRTGWLFGGQKENPKNFVWRRIVDARSQDKMTSNATQYGNPTYAPDVARQAILLVDRGRRGTYNVTSKGAASRFDYVSRIVQAARLPCIVEPGPAFARLAPVSPNEVGRNYRLSLLGLDQMPSWEDAVDRYVEALLSSAE
jgi:dTDP-4-dehydrorhamnose reductase